MQKNGDANKKESPPNVTPVRPVQRAQQEQSEKPLDPEQLILNSPQLADQIKSTVNDLKIRQEDRSWAADLVNDFRENLLKFLRSSTDQPIFQSADFLNTGSYFEKVKISSPNEFDMMLTLQVSTRLNLTPLDDGLFYRIDLTRPTRTPIQAFLMEDELTLSSSRILGEMYRLVRKFLKTYKVPNDCYHWEVNKKKPYSPAVTLSLCKPENGSDELISVDVVPALEVQSWPNAVRGGPNVENWLGKKARQEIRSLPCYFVPKRRKLARNLSEEAKSDAKESWRISFSHIEKRFMAAHGNKKTCCESKSTKCCRKQCLMLLKLLIERLKHCFPKELDALCSYHGKTAFFHTLSARYSDSQWAKKDLPICFIHLVDAFEDHAHRGVLPHFFVPQCNLFSPDAFPRKALTFLVDVLKEQKKEGLPLLKPPAPAPAPPLKPETVSAETFAELAAENSFSPSWFPSVDSSFITKIIPVLMLVFLAVLFHVALKGNQDRH
ncbi:cyclic GMP-AMP synthase isoform X2 [Salarias fasciatus]|uniref:Cyclic GMP-AMP synthase-like n=2 Tax=Salarias fasciatus TaxID=181472 RepID=A0A672HE25_SALFA|nr:cyclic GMP-AMP synthase-like isoform X2 [Salarias fasciatus]